ncbi:hypothetical protein VNO78_25133 [Psophocarpus tetragonolobus]|uniref:Uncharacterized protein n=1 Tax=Psophocarpus tetragonolobus TaxID=3891 RepID=A0AAN9S9J2_PSOTE
MCHTMIMRENQRREKKMIYRKWSLLTGPVAILGGVVVAIAAANVIFVKNDPFVKPEARKYENQPATK